MKKVESFLKVPDWYWECGLDIYEVMILCMIASWQRQDKEFFMGKKDIAAKFNCDHKVIFRRFKNLENIGLIKRGDKVGRSFKYKIDQNKLEYLKGISTSEVPIDQPGVPQRYQHSTPEVLYKNPKNSNKTILREEEEKGSSSPQTKKKEVTDVALHQFSRDINLNI